MEVPDPRPAQEHLPPLKFFGHFDELLRQWGQQVSISVDHTGPFGIQQATREPTEQEIAEFRATIQKLFGTETGPYEAQKVPILWRIRWFLIDHRVSIARKIYRFLSGEEFPDIERDWW